MQTLDMELGGDCRKDGFKWDSEMEATRPPKVVSGRAVTGQPGLSHTRAI